MRPLALQLKNLQASGIEKIELLTSPPAKYATTTNVAYINITTRNEMLGTQGNLWSNGTILERFNYMTGGNICHSTRKSELSADASWQNVNGINDLDKTYTFSDHSRISDRTNHFTNRIFGANGLFKYKFNSRFSAGGIVNFSTIRQKSNLWDETIDLEGTVLSYNLSPTRPNNALTLTAFGDWLLDTKGKMLSLTYNYFNRHTHSFADVSTYREGNEDTRLTDDGKNRYRINSVKQDTNLPFSEFRMEAGAAYTSIANNTDLAIINIANGKQSNAPTQSNAFNYEEKTAAAYLSAEKNFRHNWFGRLGLRYEYTYVKGLQRIDDMHHCKSYAYLFPSLTLSWNSQKAGHFSLSYSMGITRPNFADLNPFRYYTTVSDYYSGNPDLDPSISHNVEINYSFKDVYAVLYNSYSHDAIGYITLPTEDSIRCLKIVLIPTRLGCIPLTTTRCSRGGIST